MRRIGLAIVALILGLVACSSPDLNSNPQLGAQFGTAEDDIGLDVATVSTGRIYSLASEKGPYDYDEDGYEDGTTHKAVVRRFDNNGKLVWTRTAVSSSCIVGDEGCYPIQTRSIDTNSQGNVYVMYSESGVGGDCLYAQYTSLTMLDANGYYVTSYFLGGTSNGDFSQDYNSVATFTVDGSGNIYTGLEKAAVDSSECQATGKVQAISKLSAGGALQWQRVSTVGNVTDILISPGGSLYVAGTKGLARYSTSGTLVWSKAVGPLENVIVSGSNIYTRYRKDIRKFDANGKQLWLKTQTGLNTLIGQDISGDTSGNVYLSGKYAAGTGNYSPFVRKLNSSGSVLWTKTYGTSAYDDALGIATITGSEIYVTGETQGSLSHTNIGGRDGYLRKLNSSGNLVWSK